MFMQLLGRFSWPPATANDIFLYRRVGEDTPSLPLVPLSADSVWRLGGLPGGLLEDYSRIFPYHYAELMQMKLPATDLLPGLNLLLAVLRALTLSLPPGEKQESYIAKPEVS